MADTQNEIVYRPTRNVEEFYTVYSVVMVLCYDSFKFLLHSVEFHTLSECRLLQISRASNHVSNYEILEIGTRLIAAFRWKTTDSFLMNSLKW